jgi:hypothetical protein
MTGGKYAPRVVPDDFLERAPLLTCTQAQREFAISSGTAYAWAARLGIKYATLVKPMPDGFEAQYRTLSAVQIAATHGVATTVVERWAKSLPKSAIAEHKRAIRARIGEVAKATRARENAAKPPKPVKVKRTHGRGVTWGNAKAVPIPEAKADIVSMAMRALQRIYAPVYRAETVAGKAAIGLFKVGRMTMTEPELLALAARKGFTFSEGFAG